MTVHKDSYSRKYFHSPLLKPPPPPPEIHLPEIASNFHWDPFQMGDQYNTQGMINTCDQVGEVFLSSRKCSKTFFTIIPRFMVTHGVLVKL